MAEDTKWMHNVGEIFLSKETECFWMLPTEFFFNKTLRVTSPWFSHEGETWRLVTIWKIQKYLPIWPYSQKEPKYFVSLYMWKKGRLNPPSHEYTLEVYLKSIFPEKSLPRRSVRMNSDFGFECSEYISEEQSLAEISCCGLVKLCFLLQKQEIPVRHSHPSSSVDEKKVDNINDEDTKSSEDEISSDEENGEIISVSSKDEGVKILTKDLKQIFLDGRMSDAVLKVDGREFNVHKVILVARSPVFESMFQHDLAEKNSNAVDIPDCSAESFEVFLHYLYCGNAETMSTSNVFDVYYAADKYHVDDLKEKCVKFMINHITVETFCDVIALSLRHGESQLQKAATDFFRQNIKEVIKTVEWQTYLNENSTHANELLIKALHA